MRCRGGPAHALEARLDLVRRAGLAPTPPSPPTAARTGCRRAGRGGHPGGDPVCVVRAGAWDAAQQTHAADAARTSGPTNASRRATSEGGYSVSGTAPGQSHAISASRRVDVAQRPDEGRHEGVQSVVVDLAMQDLSPGRQRLCLQGLRRRLERGVYAVAVVVSAAAVPVRTSRALRAVPAVPAVSDVTRSQSSPRLEVDDGRPSATCVRGAVDLVSELRTGALVLPDLVAVPAVSTAAVGTVVAAVVEEQTTSAKPVDRDRDGVARLPRVDGRLDLRVARVGVAERVERARRAESRSPSTEWPSAT